MINRNYRSYSSPAASIVIGLLLGIFVFIIKGRNAASSVFMIWMLLASLYYSLTNFKIVLYLFSFLIPFEQLFFAWGGGQFNTLTYLAISIFFIGFMGFGKALFKHKQSFQEVFAFIWIIWSLFTVIWSKSDKTGFGLAFTYFGGIMILYLYARGLKTEEDVLQCLWYFIIGTLLMGLILAKYYDPFSASVWNEERARYIPSALALGTEIAPAEFARSLGVAFFGALALWELEANLLLRRIAFILAVIFVIMTFLTLNRTAMVGQVLSLLVWVFFRRANFKEIKKLFFIFILVSLIVSTILLINPPALKERLDSTISSYKTGETVTLTSGRSEIWQVAWKLFLNQPIFGIGLGSFPLEYSRETGDVPKGEHSVFFQLLCETGIIGFTLFVILLIALWQKAKRTEKWKHNTLAWWTLFVITISTHGLDRAKEFWFVFGITSFLVWNLKISSVTKLEKDKGGHIGYSAE